MLLSAWTAVSISHPPTIYNRVAYSPDNTSGNHGCRMACDRILSRFYKVDLLVLVVKES